MPTSAKTRRAQLMLLKPMLENCSLETLRSGQNRIGSLMGAKQRRRLVVKPHPFPQFRSAWLIPRDERREGVILYLHGGGYTCGGLKYAQGFGGTLAVYSGTRVFCAAYRLAPEHRYPAALEDALEAYRYLLSKGYTGGHILLCGESAGGGLCYSLCMRLRQLGLPMPGGIIAISPWSDLTASGSSYEENKENDPSMTLQRLRFFAECYTDDPADPLVSPLLGDLSGMPPSLIFAGGDEIMLSDARDLHEKLLSLGCGSTLRIRPERWHAYLLYDLPEDKDDHELVRQFLNRHLSQERKLRWLKLDNAAKIYPAARRQNWSNVFRLSATLTEEVDAAVLQSALDVTVRRFPSIAARLRRGTFWYYLEQVEHAPELRRERAHPLTRMSGREIRSCAFRVIVYGRRIAVEMFHSLTDGTGALIFLKSLVAEYLQQKYGVRIPAELGVLGRLEEPSEAELEDSFQKNAGPISASRRENDAWHLTGTPEQDGFLNLTCFRLPVEAVRAKAKEMGVSVTVFLCAALMMALQNLQETKVSNPRRRKPIKVQIPINLRNLFPSRTLRNFALYTTPEILPRLGRYEFSEICQAVRHRLGLENTAKQMGMKIAANVSSERLLAVRLMPLFLKNIVMKAIFDLVGEKKACMAMSNLGVVRIPAEMEEYVERFDFILGVQATAPYNCGVISYGDAVYVNFIRNIRESELEYHFHCVLRDMGLPVQVQSNRPED